MSRRRQRTVVLFDIQERSDKKRPYYVRWSYAGRETSRAFEFKTDAKDFWTDLRDAIKDGERFSTETLQPVSWELEDRTIAKISKEFVDSVKSKWAPKTRQSNLWPIAEALVLLVPKRAATPPDFIHQSICDWLMSDGGQCPSWLNRHSLSLAECTREVCSDAMAKLEKKRVVAKGESPNKSPNTVNRYRRAVSQVFGYAARRDLLTYNPWPQAERGKKTRAEQTTEVSARQRPSADQILDNIAKMRNHKPSSRDYQTAANIIWHTGMRPSEARALRIENCVLPDTGLGSAFVEDNVQGGTKRFWMSHDKQIDLPKTGLKRRIPLSPEIVAIIKEHIGDRTTDLICRTQDGGLISETNLERAWARCRGEMSSVRLYDLRHTHATMAVRAGASPDKVAKWLGNSKEVLVNIYLGELPDDEAVALSIYESGLFAKKTTVTTPKSRPKTSKKSKRSVNTTKKR